jgi:hypothetical protein
MTSKVSMGSALILLISSLDGDGIQQAIANERKSRGCKDLIMRVSETPPITPRRRKRTRPLAEYDAGRPCNAPDLQIGLRRPVSCILHLTRAIKCEVVHIWAKKFRPASESPAACH